MVVPVSTHEKDVGVVAPGSWWMMYASSRRCKLAVARPHNDMGDHFAKATSGRPAPSSSAATYVSSLSLCCSRCLHGFVLSSLFCLTEHTSRGLPVLLRTAILGFGVLYSRLASRLSLGRWCPDPRTVVVILLRIPKPTDCV